MSQTISEKTWVQQILKKYKAIKKLRPKPVTAAIDEWPKWVPKLWPILHKISHPGLKVLDVKEWTAKDLGQFLGRQNAIDGLIRNEVPLSQRVKEETKRRIDLEAQKPGLSSNLETALKQNASGLEEWRTLFLKFIDQTLASARQRPYPESSAFFQAFGKANVIKPDELAIERTIGVRERIAYCMFLCWRDIAKLQSVAEVHKFLSEAAKSKGIVISLKRVEKFCQQIGLKFRGRGRPKNKIQKNPATAS